MITTKSRSLLSPPKEAKKYSERFSSTERNIKKKKKYEHTERKRRELP
jgi:hypothetical protein